MSAWLNRVTWSTASLPTSASPTKSTCQRQPLSLSLLVQNVYGTKSGRLTATSLAKARISGALSCMRPAVSTSTTSSFRDWIKYFLFILLLSRGGGVMTTFAWAIASAATPAASRLYLNRCLRILQEINYSFCVPFLKKPGIKAFCMGFKLLDGPWTVATS